MDKTIVAPRERPKRDATAYHSGTTRLASHAARLIALNSGRWPRGISEDRLIPDHIVPIDVFDGGDNAGINATV